MNKRQKILTVMALVVFGAIVGADYYFGVHYVAEPLTGIPPDLWPTHRTSLVERVGMPLLLLAVFYAGLFFILATPKAKGPQS
jgi:hypothetical protein